MRRRALLYGGKDYSKQYLTFVALADGRYKLSTNAVNYSLDNGSTWTELAADTYTPTVSAGSKVMWKAEITPTSTNGVGTFSSTAYFNAEGNPLSLILGDNFEGVTTLPGTYAFYKLFSENGNLVSAKNLSLCATTITSSCYTHMFSGCTSLTTAPELPATTLDSYCYAGMFKQCSYLTNVPNLPAMDLATSCYSSMFYGCTELTTAPELPATTLARDCYSYMFRGCTGLTTAPELPATTLVVTCYSYMFYGCSSLNYIKAMFTTTPSPSVTNYWVSGVASSGTFVKNSSATWDVTGVSGVPSGWTVETADS